MALPNLRRLFVEARTEAEENEYSRNAVEMHPSRISPENISDGTRSFIIWYFSSPRWQSSAWSLRE